MFNIAAAFFRTPSRRSPISGLSLLCLFLGIVGSSHTVSGQTSPVTRLATAGNVTLTVPAGMDIFNVQLRGGNGEKKGTGSSSGAAGVGAQSHVKIPVSPGDKVNIRFIAGGGGNTDGGVGTSVWVDNGQWATVGGGGGGGVNAFGSVGAGGAGRGVAGGEGGRGGLNVTSLYYQFGFGGNNGVGGTDNHGGGSGATGAFGKNGGGAGGTGGTGGNGTGFAGGGGGGYGGGGGGGNGGYGAAGGGGSGGKSSGVTVVSSSSAPAIATQTMGAVYYFFDSVNDAQQTVTITPTSRTVDEGDSVTFTASGGSGTGAYTWGGPASGTGTSKTVTFTTNGTRTVTVYRAASSGYLQSNTASASITIRDTQAAVTLTPTSRTINLGDSITFTAAGGSGTGAYTWGGSASGTGSSKAVTFSTSGTRTVTVYRAASAGFGQSNTVTATITVLNEQADVSISPSTQTIEVGDNLTFTAAGGSGTGAYTWGGDGSGTGTTKAVTFASPGTRTVTVYRAASSGYTASNTATAIITVQIPQTVSLSPASQTVAQGTSVAFTASGGNNGYSWGGSASGTGTTKSITFPTVGTFTVSVTSPAGGSYGASNTASSTITVTPPADPPSLSLSVQAQALIFPADVVTLVADASVTSGTIAYYDWRIVTPSYTSAYQRKTGPANPLSGTHNFTVAEIGAHRFEVTATTAEGGVASASAPFNVVQGIFMRTISAQAVPSTSKSIWFTPSQTATTSVQVQKVR